MPHRMRKWKYLNLIIVTVAMLLLSGCQTQEDGKKQADKFSDIPNYTGELYVTINDNVPFFEESELSESSYEHYSELDSLGRCGVAVACIGKDLMPDEERGPIGQIRPSGWHTVKYDLVDGKYLYNRCHLIGFQLAGENDNEKNLITGTRALNVEGMLPFENMLDSYIEETGNHVMYRVTPIYENKNLLAKGVLLEAKSVEDNGSGVQFNVFVHNVQEGVTIDYATGESCLQDDEMEDAETVSPNATADSETVWISANGSKYHTHNHCGVMNTDKANQISEKEAQERGFTACKKCH